MDVNITDPTYFHLVYQVLRTSGYPITHLELGHPAFGVPLSLFEPFKPSTTFTNLRKLHLALEPTWKEMQIVEEGLTSDLNILLRNFRAYLRECHNLEDFALIRTNYNLGRRTSELIFEAVCDIACSKATPTLTKLEHFSLEGFFFKWEHLVSFVAATRSSLKSLTVILQQGITPEPTEAVRQLQTAHGAGELELHGPMFGEVDENSDGLFD